MIRLLSSAASVGIIGGADGPTAVFVTYPDDPWKYVLGAAVLAAVITFIIRRKRRR